MRRRSPFILILLLQFAFTGIHAQLFSTDLQKGFKAFDNNNYDKAIEIFNGMVSGDSSGVGANFGIAEVYFSRDYSGYSPEKAYQHITIAESNFSRLNKKQLSSLAKANIDKQKIDNATLAERNRALMAQIRELKEGTESIEAKARTDMGMIKEGETFYFITDDTRPAKLLLSAPQTPAHK